MLYLVLVHKNWSAIASKHRRLMMILKYNIGELKNCINHQTDRQNLGCDTNYGDSVCRNDCMTAHKSDSVRHSWHAAKHAL